MTFTKYMIHPTDKTVQAIYEVERAARLYRTIAGAFFAACAGFFITALIYIGLVSTASAAEFIYYDNTGAAVDEIKELNQSPQIALPTYSAGYAGWLPLTYETTLTNNTLETCDIVGLWYTQDSAGVNAFQYSDNTTVAFQAGVPMAVTVTWSASAYGIEDNGGVYESIVGLNNVDCTGFITIGRSLDTIADTSAGQLTHDTIAKFTITGAYLANVTIIEPDQSEIIKQATFNASGLDAYYSFITTDVDMTAYPNESPAYELEIYNATRTTLECLMTGSGSGSVDGSNNYGVQLNHKVHGNPEPCENLALGNYSMRARVYMAGPTVSDWSAWTDFTIAATAYGDITDCPNNGSIYGDFTCWITNAATAAFIPSTAAIEGVMSTIDDLGDQFPFSWVTGSYNALTAAMDQEADVLGAAVGGNPLKGEFPNIAWIALQIKQFYGTWASGAAAFFIWLTALISISRAGMRLLNIETDDGLDI